MASIPITTTSPPPTPIYRSSFPARSEALCNLFPKSPARIIIQRKRSMRVEAMGGVPKFKGTQMREKQLTEMIEKKVMEAKEVCEGNTTSDECKVAWDEVEEVSQAKADFKLKLEVRDPLEFFCQDHPETDECRVYED
ncbi:calvin cycle protein CP12-3, chloroplastic [Euphorbia lathyris]|uniref:calvin cycle protein CP12-3, chloroplastic n=1 Tax=Euphorbia lathyris TaxID=212925 RepID=UPI00331334B4